MKSKTTHDEGRPSSPAESDLLDLPENSADPVYAAKATVLNSAIQDIGMGKYQWQLFFVVGFGWASDNLWPIVTGLILIPINKEFKPDKIPLLTLSQNIGLLAGAVFWGFGCDIFGRRMAFNLTILITAVFGLVAASSPNFAAIGIFAALWSVGVGGNLPVDSAIFLEFLPGTHQYLLTVLSIFWAMAQLMATLIAWPLLSNLTCQENQTTCTRGENMGWRYFMIVMGGIALIMFILRYFFFTLYESPKYLMGRGRDSEAIRVVHEVARRNGKTSNITLEDLSIYDERFNAQQRTTTTAALSRQLESLKFEHIRALFATPKLVLSTSMIMAIWAFIGLGFPLYNAFLPFLQSIRGVDFGDTNSVYITYRNSLIIAVLGIPGALLGAFLVESRIGRKGALAISTTLTGVFLFCSTTAKNSNDLLGWNCAYNLMSNVMYAVLYAYTPEVFETRHRGTGNALTAMSNRIFGIMAPVVAMYANLNTAVPVYVSGGLFVGAGILCIFLPFESRGKASL
eukprot:GHVU01119949.1.p1 GENE.GHVU01119949.1~~GHVU01119949.1.p1  ORF type:complete len:529 (-),score=30.65 GHVU01119949.1:117-1655(-)